MRDRAVSFRHAIEILRNDLPSIFSDRTLGLTIPDNGRKAGAELRERLTRIGILNAETGHELYRGMLTIPPPSI
jgi:hypothetical protein